MENDQSGHPHCGKKRVTTHGHTRHSSTLPPRAQCMANCHTMATQICNLLQDGIEDGVYKFALNEEEILLMPRYTPYDNKTQLLGTEENVSENTT